MKNWVINFINDERGAESIELGVSGAIVAGGAVAGLSLVKDKVQEKQDELVDKLDESTAS
jgi:Flp pilus assembly pilin Flp